MHALRFQSPFHSNRIWIPVGIILLLHFGMSVCGLHSVLMNGYMQIAQTNFPAGTPFWEMIYYFHGNPPALSIFHHLADSLFPHQSYLFFELLLPLLHAGSVLFFNAALRNFNIRIHHFWILLLFLNPLVFLYFRYPFYSSILFFLNSALLFLFSKREKDSTTWYWVAAVFSLETLLRSTYLTVMLLPLLIWMMPVRKSKPILIVVLIMVPSFLWQLKNYMIVGKFSSGTWIGMNLARCHMPWNVHNDLVAFVSPLSLPDQYFELLKDEPRVKACLGETNYYLSQNNLNHRVIPVISDLYIESIQKEFSAIWSLNTWINGFLILFKSPMNYEHIRRHLVEAGYGKFQFLNPDFLEPIGFDDGKPWYLFFEHSGWDPGFERINALKRLTVYSFLYPFLLIWFGLHFRRFSKPIQAVYMLTFWFTMLYSIADIFEANRMRMEYEVFFYFLLLVFIAEIRKPNRKPETKGTDETNLTKGIFA